MLVCGKKGPADVLSGILYYIIAGILILNQNTIWRFLEGAPENFSQIVTIILIAAVCAGLIIKLVRDPSKRTSSGFIAPSFILLYMAVFLLLNGFFPYYFMELAASVFALGLYFFICNDHRFPETLKAYRNIVTVIAALSILMWLLCSVFKVIPATQTVNTSWGPVSGYMPVNSFFGIYFEPQTVRFLGHSFIRNCAFFAEGPMASLAFTFGFLTELLLNKKPKLIILAILFAGVFSTFSVTGIIICIVPCMIKLVFGWMVPAIKKIESAAKRRTIIIVISAAVLTAAVFAVYIAVSRLGSDSASIRMDDFRSGIKAWLDSPIIGNGFMNDYSIMAYMGEWRGENLGFSNSITQVLAHTGLYLGALYLVPFTVGIIQSIRSRRPGRLLFVVCTLMLFCMTIFSYSYTILFLLYYFAFGKYRKVSDT